MCDLNGRYDILLHEASPQQQLYLTQMTDHNLSNLNFHTLFLHPDQGIFSGSITMKTVVYVCHKACAGSWSAHIIYVADRHATARVREVVSKEL